MKKFNNQTGCYKIDIFIDGVYYCSTEQSKNCKIAKDRFIALHPKNTGKVTAHYWNY